MCTGSISNVWFDTSTIQCHQRGDVKEWNGAVNWVYTGKKKKNELKLNSMKEKKEETNQD